MNEAATTEPMQDIVAATMVNDLMSITLDELKAAGDVWHRLGETEQDEAIARIEKRVKDAIRECVELFATSGFARVPAKLDAITIKGAIKVALSVNALPHSAEAHELFQAQGSSCVIVLADPSDFMQSHDHKPDADQLGLALGGIAGSDEAQPDAE